MPEIPERISVFVLHDYNYTHYCDAYFVKNRIEIGRFCQFGASDLWLKDDGISRVLTNSSGRLFNSQHPIGGFLLAALCTDHFTPGPFECLVCCQHG